MTDHVVVGTGKVGTRFIRTEWPVEEGIIAGTTKNWDRPMALVAENSVVRERDMQGVDI